jgi:membrane protein
MLKKILTTPTAQLGRVSRFAIFQVKLWSHCARLLNKNRAGQQAAALAYHTIFGIVPLAIVVLLIFQSFPAYSDIAEQVKTIIYEQLNLVTLQISDPAKPEGKILFTEHLDGIVERVFAGLSEGGIAIVSVVIIIWAALGLLLTTERSFNNIWHVGRGRNFLHRIINYWALLTLGPLLLGVGIYVTTIAARYRIVGQFQETVLAHFGPVAVSYVLSVVAFFLLYFVLPNTKVKAGAAIWGAAVAALVWILAKWAFGLYVTKFIPYGKIYGVLGLIPLTVFWIYITWLIVLFGLQLTFTTQHLKSLDAAEIAAAKRSEDYFIANDVTVINIVSQIASAFEESKAPIGVEVLSSRLNMPAEFTEKILSHLVESGIVLKVSEPRVGFIVAKDPANIKLSDISEAVASGGFAQSPEGRPAMLEQITQSQKTSLSQYNLKQILGYRTDGQG